MIHITFAHQSVERRPLPLSNLRTHAHTRVTMQINRPINSSTGKPDGTVAHAPLGLFFSSLRSYLRHEAYTKLFRNNSQIGDDSRGGSAAHHSRVYIHEADANNVVRQ